MNSDASMEKPMTTELGLASSAQTKAVKNKAAGTEDAEDSFSSDFKHWLSTHIEVPENIIETVNTLDMSDKDLEETLKVLQQVINGYYLEFQNMFDNYVCFLGEKDEAQLKRFINAAFAREKKNWDNIISNKDHGSISVPSLEAINEQVCYCIRDKFLKENKLIIEYEGKLANKVTQDLLQKAESKLNYIIAQKADERQMIQIGQLMLTEGSRIITKSLNFGGRLNNVTGSHIESFCKSLNQKFEKLVGYTMTSHKSISSPTDKQPNQDDIYLRYVKKVQEKLFQYSPTNWEIFHDSIFQEICSNKDTLEKDTEMRLVTYLVFASERKQESQSRSMDSSTKSISPSQIIHITDELLKVAIKDGNFWTFVKFQGNESQNLESCHATVSCNKGIFSFGYDPFKKEKLGSKALHGKIFNFITEVPGTDKAEEMLQKLFQKLRTYRSDGGNGACMVIIPSWFSPRNHALLRRSIKMAGIRNCILVHESSLVAYQHLQELPNSNQLVCIVMARNDAVRVEIFEKFHSKTQSISLAAMAYGEWTKRGDSRNDDIDTKDSKNPLRYFNPVLVSTLSRAFNQLPATKECIPYVAYVITDNPKWKPYLLEMLIEDLPSTHPHQPNLILSGVTEDASFAVEGAKLLCNVSSNIENILLDFAIPKTSVILEYTMPENDKTHYFSKLSQAQENLIEKCNIVERQIVNEEMKVGIITKKLILEAVQTARQTVRMNGNLAKAENVIDELMK